LELVGIIGFQPCHLRFLPAFYGWHPNLSYKAIPTMAKTDKVGLQPNKHLTSTAGPFQKLKGDHSCDCKKFKLNFVLRFL